MQERGAGPSQIVNSEGRHCKAHALKGFIQGIGGEGPGQASPAGQDQSRVPGKVFEFFKHREHLAREIHGMRLARFE